MGKIYLPLCRGSEQDLHTTNISNKGWNPGLAEADEDFCCWFQSRKLFTVELCWGLSYYQPWFQRKFDPLDFCRCSLTKPQFVIQSVSHEHKNIFLLFKKGIAINLESYSCKVINAYTLFYFFLSFSNDHPVQHPGMRQVSTVISIGPTDIEKVVVIFYWGDLWCHWCWKNKTNMLHRTSNMLVQS